MKTAKEMNEITKKAQEQAIFFERLAATTFAENTLMSRIEETAKNGGHTLCYSKKLAINWNCVEELLRSHGYTVDNKSNLFYVSW